MKIITKYFLIILLVIILISICKNIILFFSYNYDIEYATKVSEKENSFSALINSYEAGYEMQKDIRVTFFDNNTGEFNTEIYNFKIDGEVSEELSFHSLLPYDREKKEVISYKLIWSDDYLKILESPNDTIFTKYKIINNKLYIDKNRHYTKYESSPEWGFSYNKGLKFWDIFQFWLL